MVVKRVAGDQIGPVHSATVPLAEADAGHLRVGEHDQRVEAVVEAVLGAVGMRGIVRGDLALLNGDVDDFVLAVDVADGVDVGLAGAHGRIDDNAPVGDLDASLVQAQFVDEWAAAEGLENEICRGCFFCAAVGKMRRLAPVFLGELAQLGASVHLHAFLAEVCFNWSRQILVASGENVIAALDERHLRANALKELGQLDGNRAAAEDEEARWLLAQVENLVAGEVADLVQPWYWDVVRRGAGGDDEMPGLNDVVVGLELLRREEAAARFVEREAAVA